MFLLLAFCVILYLLYLYGTRNYNYWKKIGVIHDKPYPFIGNTSIKQLLFRISFTDFFSQIYWKFPNERFVGFYSMSKPVLIIREPRDVEHVLTRDFHAFYLRGMKMHEEDPDPMQNHLFGLDGDLWKLLRQRMTPAFTSGKLKDMFPLIVERAEKLQILAAERAENDVEVDVKDLISRYTTDFIGACGFGINMDALNDENSVFRKLGKRIFTMEKSDVVRVLLKTLLPATFKNMPAVAPEITSMTTSLVKSIMEQRNYQPSSRKDFIDLLLEVKKKGNMVGESIEKKNPDGSSILVEKELDEMLIVAQVFVFFAAGFETSSSTSSHTLHQLAFHPEEQKKAQEEIDQVLKKYDDKLCYEAVNEMKYLRMCFNESMRIFPSVGILIRKSAQSYTFPDSDVTIEKGTGIFICNHAMQNDEKYFEEPEKFIPERFSHENSYKFPKHVFMPFGEGPRACIGERLGLMQSLAGLAAILHKFSVVPSPNTKRYPETDPMTGLVQTKKGGVPLKLISRKKNN